MKIVPKPLEPVDELPWEDNENQEEFIWQDDETEEMPWEDEDDPRLDNYDEVDVVSVDFVEAKLF